MASWGLASATTITTLKWKTININLNGTVRNNAQIAVWCIRRVLDSELLYSYTCYTHMELPRVSLNETVRAATFALYLVVRSTKAYRVEEEYREKGERDSFARGGV